MLTFQELQDRFSRQYPDIFYHNTADKTIVIVPSLTLDEEILGSIKGAQHYEERLLCLLMLLSMPRTHVIYVSSVQIDSSIIDYYLHLLPGITGYHARQRLHLFSAYDASGTSLTKKLLSRPRLLERIKAAIHRPEMAHMVCFNVTELEKQLAETLQIPIYGCDPGLAYLGSKSGCRHLFKQLNVPLPPGFEDLTSEADIAAALAKLKIAHPSLRKAVIKINEGFSGDGNAIYHYQSLSADDPYLEKSILQSLRDHTQIVASNLSYDQFMHSFQIERGIVEEFMDGVIKTSPSVQCRINPVGVTEVISTHDQLLGGESGQIYLGATFPADPAYSREIALLSKPVAEELMKRGVLGRFAIDFLSVKEADGWKHYAIEINLRKGGTTHPYLMLKFLTAGEYTMQEGVFRMPNGAQRCYFTSDNVVDPCFIGLTPHDLIDIAMCNQLLYDSPTQRGVIFHMIGALSQFGKIGMVCIGETVEEAKAFYDKTVEVLKTAAHDPSGKPCR
jgi:hypothetical protein